MGKVINGSNHQWMDVVFRVSRLCRLDEVRIGCDGSNHPNPAGVFADAEKATASTSPFCEEFKMNGVVCFGECSNIACKSSNQGNILAISSKDVKAKSFA